MAGAKPREQLIAGWLGCGGRAGAVAWHGQPGSVGKTVVVFPAGARSASGWAASCNGELPVFAQAFDAVATS